MCNPFHDCCKWLCSGLLALGIIPLSQMKLIGAEPKIEASSSSLEAWKYRLSPEDEALLDKVQHGCFQYFWKEVGSPAMLAKDKTSDTICSTAAVGFQLSSLPIGVERGWITR